MELIEGVNIGKLPDIFETLTNDNKIIKVKKNQKSLNEEYLYFLNKINDQSDKFREINEGEIVKGEIVSISKKEIIMDIGYKDNLFVENKVSDLKIIENLKVGDTIDVVVTVINDNPFYIRGSIVDLIKLQVSDKLKDFYYKNKPLLAMVTEMKPAGFMLDIEMDNVIVNAFMPTTLAGINKLTDDQKDEIIGQKIYVMLETLQMDKGIYVVSRKKYLKTLIKDELKKLKEEFDKNRNVIYDGTVTGTTPFGIFVEFNKCLTGMIHRYNVNEQWTGDDKWGDIKPGMVIQFYVKDIIVKKQKVILTQILRESLWDTIKKDKVMDGTVYDIKSFGVLVKLDEETNGLIQSSYLNKNNVNLSIGHNVKVRVLNVIKDDRKIYLGIVKNK